MKTTDPPKGMGAEGMTPCGSLRVSRGVRGTIVPSHGSVFTTICSACPGNNQGTGRK